MKELFYDNSTFRLKYVTIGDCDKLFVTNSKGYSLHVDAIDEVNIKDSNINFIMVGLYKGDDRNENDNVFRKRTLTDLTIDAEGGLVLIQDSKINTLTVTNLGETGEVYIKESNIKEIKITK